LGQIFGAKKNYEVRRRKLYVTAAIFVSSILVLSVLNQICILTMQNVALFDFLMELYLCLSLFFYFGYWDAVVQIFVEEKYLSQLKKGDNEKFIEMFQKYNANLTKGTKTHTEVELMALEGSKAA